MRGRTVGPGERAVPLQNDGAVIVRLAGPTRSRSRIQQESEKLEAEYEAGVPRLGSRTPWEATEDEVETDDVDDEQEHDALGQRSAGPVGARDGAHDLEAGARVAVVHVAYATVPMEFHVAKASAECECGTQAKHAAASRCSVAEDAGGREEWAPARRPRECQTMPTTGSAVGSAAAASSQRGPVAAS